MTGTHYSMDQETLSRLGRQTEAETEELAQLVRNFIAAAEPIAHSFNGPARAAFNQFKANADAISAQLTNALIGLRESIAGQDQAFTEGMVEAAEAHKAHMSGADWSAEGVLHRLSGQ